MRIGRHQCIQTRPNVNTGHFWQAVPALLPLFPVKHVAAGLGFSALDSRWTVRDAPIDKIEDAYASKAYHRHTQTPID